MDSLLRHFGQLLRRLLRKGDLAIHHGGGVFFIISPDTTLPQSVLAAERLRAQILSHDLGRPLVVYQGCTIYLPGEDNKDFVARARLALLEAVKAGPNKVAQRDPWGKMAPFPSRPLKLDSL
jgi:GGDEF domain-containing protein